MLCYNLCSIRISYLMRENQRYILRLLTLCYNPHLVKAVLELLGPGPLELGAPLVLRHLGPLLGDHVLQVVDLVLELVLLVPEKSCRMQIKCMQKACIERYLS